MGLQTPSPNQDSTGVIIPELEGDKCIGSKTLNEIDQMNVARANVSWMMKFKTSNLASFNTRVYSKTLRAQASVEEERKRHFNSFPSTIHPHSDLRWCADIFITCLSIVYMVFQPIQISYYSGTLGERNSVIITGIFSIVFFLDIYLNFKTGIHLHERDEAVLDSKVIALNYLKTWFFLDFISSVPYNSMFVIVNVLMGQGQLSLKYFRLLELLKVFRLARIVRLLSKFERGYTMKNSSMRIVNLVITMLFLIHWLACLHYFIADMFNTPPHKRGELSWVSQMDLWEHPVWEKYIHGVLRALSNMAFLGYGFVTPRAPEDVLCTIISIVVGATCFALFIANLSNMVINLDIAHKKYNESLRQIKDYMKLKRMPRELQDRVTNYFRLRYGRNLFNEEEIMNEVSDVLREQLQMFNCQKLVQQVPLFKGIRLEILEEIVAQLKFEVYLPKDVIIHENTIGKAMYFIERGSVSVLGPSGKLVNTLNAGNFFGEMALVTNERRSASVVAMTSCDIYLLMKSDFERVVHQYQEVYAAIVEVAKKRARERKISEPEGPGSSDTTIKSSAFVRPERKSIQELDFVIN